MFAAYRPRQIKASVGVSSMTRKPKQFSATHGITDNFFFLAPFQIEVTSPTAIDPSPRTMMTTLPGLGYQSKYTEYINTLYKQN